MPPKDKSAVDDIDVMELVLALAKKKPILTMFFLFIALYGLGQFFFSGR
jgi:hypothetical protein